MDLLATVRKEGSRGGLGDFKWSDVQTSGRRENYLGHSLMAPVGRWQKGRDLNWYAKSNDATETCGGDLAEKEARERREEIKKIKEAEQDALARALGLPVPDRNNANMEPLGEKASMGRSLIDTSGVDDDGETKGIGFDSGRAAEGGVTKERIEGNAESQDRELQYALKEYRRRQEVERRNTTSDGEAMMIEAITTKTDRDLLKGISAGQGQDHAAGTVMKGMKGMKGVKCGIEVNPHAVMMNTENVTGIEIDTGGATLIIEMT